MRRYLAAGLVALFGLLGLVVATSAPVGAEASGGCRPVGGTPSVTGGPHRATVVVDPGSGDVWSACISFAGTITGAEALALAADLIPGLDPVFEPYPGQGQAVCRLLGVGNDPPDCLSKTVEYWSYFRNGSYARGGPGASTVTDGDVEGWSFSRGKPPRPATRGSEAVAASALPSPPVTAPPSTGPNPSSPGGGTSTTGAGGNQGTSPPPGSGVGPSSSVPGPDTTGSAGSTNGTSIGGESPQQPSSTVPGGSDQPSGHSSDPVTAGGGRVTVTEAAESGSSLGSILGFGGALATVGVAAVWVRRRRKALDAD